MARAGLGLPCLGVDNWLKYEGIMNQGGAGSDVVIYPLGVSVGF